MLLEQNDIFDTLRKINSGKIKSYSDLSIPSNRLQGNLNA
jgi:hypothetical protein